VCDENGKVLTVCGKVEPQALGRVMMHEHLCSDMVDWTPGPDYGVPIYEEGPTSQDLRRYLLDNAVPHLTACRTQYGMGAYVDVTPPPWRLWPTVYQEVSQASGVHIVLCTGYYREVETGTYWVKTPADAIWPYVLQASVEEMAELCIREITEGIHGTGVRAGTIKLGTSQAPMTEAEVKTFRAGARAQKATGVSITTHCTRLGAETSQLTILDLEGVDLSRVVIGHTASHLASPAYRKTILWWMERGASFMPTNLGVKDVAADAERWRPLVEGVHEVFDAGHGDKLVLGLDSGYCSESGPVEPMRFLPPHPWLHLFTNTLPAFRALGLTSEEEEAMTLKNPQRVLPVQS